MRIIVHPNNARNDYDRAVVVDVGEVGWIYCYETDRHYEYLDTPFGTFKRSINYWFKSPYGWTPVSWG